MLCWNCTGWCRKTSISSTNYMKNWSNTNVIKLDNVIMCLVLQWHQVTVWLKPYANAMPSWPNKTYWNINIHILDVDLKPTLILLKTMFALFLEDDMFLSSNKLSLCHQIITGKHCSHSNMTMANNKRHIVPMYIQAYYLQLSNNYVILITIRWFFSAKLNMSWKDWSFRFVVNFGHDSLICIDTISPNQQTSTGKLKKIVLDGVMIA